MTYISYNLSQFIVTVSHKVQGQTELKRYEVKSGMVEYATTSSGKMMGSTISGEGSEKLYFKDFGEIELREDE